MGSSLMVVLAPGLYDPAGIREAQEPVFIEAFIPKSPVKALAVGVLDWLAWVDEVQRHRVLVRPRFQRPTDQFGPVVQHELQRAVPLGKEAVKNPDDPPS